MKGPIETRAAELFQERADAHGRIPNPTPPGLHARCLAQALDEWAAKMETRLAAVEAHEYVAELEARHAELEAKPEPRGFFGERLT